MHAQSKKPSPTTRISVAGVTVGMFFAAMIGCSRDSGTAPTTATSNAVSDKDLSAALPAAKTVDFENPVVRIKTNLGSITLKLDGAKAPGTVRNFLNYATEGYYDNTLVHFVAPGKMLVAGGYAANGQPKPPRTPIRNEAHNELKNVRGAIAMTRDPALIDSATSQFFINLENAPQRDHRGDSADQYGYCVFGQVTDGLDVADRIAQSPTKSLGGDLEQTPDPAILITSIRIVP